MGGCTGKCACVSVCAFVYVCLCAHVGVYVRLCVCLSVCVCEHTCYVLMCEMEYHTIYNFFTHTLSRYYLHHVHQKMLCCFYKRHMVWMSPLFYQDLLWLM